jgi:TRAP-type C4-dicarboxylate transport system permease large subunit
MGVKKMQFMTAVTETLGPTVMIFIILVGAFIFSSFLAASQLPVAMADIVTNSGLHRMTVLTLILAIFFILGMFMSSTAMVVIMLPVVFPIIANLGFEPIWFGVIIIKMTEIGVITPPVGLNVYAVKSAVGDVVTMEDIFKGIAPFLIMEIITLAILVMFPILSMLIPNMMRG